ncbi:MAG: hypothetical protein PVF17_01825 [Ignavibacteria bacterium]|jgi:hypothetical protein
MKSAVLFLILISSSNLMSQKNIGEDYIDLTKVKMQENTDLFQIKTIENEQLLILEGNQYNEVLDDFTGKKIDDVRGKAILIGEPQHDYSMIVDMKFMGINMDFPGGGWFGFVLRAQDLENYEVIWFMPGGTESDNNIAYVPVAHNVVPWWTEAYGNQEKGNYPLPKDDWFTARVDVTGDEFSLYVNDKFILNKKMTYYLTSGTPGLFVGTATDVAFRRIKIEEIKK